MSLLRIRHETGFQYDGEATASYNEARMLPTSSPGQLVLESHLDILPISSSHGYVDYWGTRVTSFEVLAPHAELSLAASSLVELRPAAHDAGGFGWEELAAEIESRTEYVEQVGQTPRTAPPEQLAALAREVRSVAATPCAAAEAIARTVGERIEYMPGSTTVTSTAEEAWAAGRGVCQDIAHLAIGALRSVGIPARYVSGYLHPARDPVVGETAVGESHAWVEWFCGSWHGFDPTNLVDIGERHVRVGHGRDYADVPPLRGVYAGPSGSRLFVKVEITKEA